MDVKKLFSEVLSVALIYLLLGSLTYLHAISSEYSAPFWPMIGFSMLVFSVGTQLSKIALISVSLFVRYLFAMSVFAPVFGATSFYIAIIIGLLELLTAFILSYSIRGIVSNRTSSRQFSNLAKFYLFTAPSIIFISVVAGNLMLDGFFVWSSHTYWNLFNWIVGNLMAVYLFFPIVIVLKSKVKGGLFYYGLRIALPIFGFTLLASFAYSFVNKYEFENSSYTFVETANQVQQKLNHSSAHIKDGLEMACDLLGLFGDLREIEFQALAAIELEHLIGVQAMNWMEVVSAENRFSFEKEIRDGGYENFEIKKLSYKDHTLIPAEEADYYIPIKYTFPYLPNKEAHGLDLRVHPIASSALKWTLATGEVSATPPFRLAQDKQGHYGVVYYLVCQNYASTRNWDSVDSMKGMSFCSFVLDLNNFLIANLREFDLNGIDIEMHKEDSPDSAPFAFVHNSNDSINEGSPDLNSLTVIRPISIANQNILLKIRSHNSSLSLADRVGSVSFMGIALLCVILLGAYLILIFNRTIQIENEVSVRTSELNQAKEEAEKATRLKNEFLATTNHELRTPLNGIIATAEILLDEKLSQTQRSYTEMILSSGRILLDLINDVLDFSQLESGKLEIYNYPFSFEQLTKDWNSIFEIVALKKKLNFEINTEGNISQLVMGDTRRINQVVINLLGNSCKFTEKGAVCLSLFLKDLGDKIEVLISVKDTGPGISLDKQKYLFEAFHQGDGEIGKKFGGTGLGLSICKHLSELMDWELKVKSAAGEGAEFTFSGVLDKYEEPEITTNVAPTDVVDLESKRVFVVEDNPVNRKVIGIVLKKLEMIPVFAANGKIALEKVNGDHFDLILLDCQLPDIDGPDLCRKFRAMQDEEWLKSVPIIALTANTEERNRQECYNAGMNDFMAKPIQIAKVRDMVSKWLKISSEQKT